MKLELVIPAYNEEKSLETLIDKVVIAAKNYCLSAKEFSLVIVENGSLDQSAAVLERLADTDLGEWFRVVSVSQNQGYGYGMWQGLKTCTAKIIAWSHADLQCDPEDVFKGYRLLVDANDRKIAVKGHREGRNRKDVFLSQGMAFVSSIILNLKEVEINAQPKVFYREMLETIKNPPNDFSFEWYAVYSARKGGFKFREIPVYFPARQHGTSKWAYSTLSRYRTIFSSIMCMIKIRLIEGQIRG